MFIRNNWKNIRKSLILIKIYQNEYFHLHITFNYIFTVNLLTAN